MLRARCGAVPCRSAPNTHIPRSSGPVSRLGRPHSQPNEAPRQCHRSRPGLKECPAALGSSLCAAAVLPAICVCPHNAPRSSHAAERREGAGSVSLTSGVSAVFTRCTRTPWPLIPSESHRLTPGHVLAYEILVYCRLHLVKLVIVGNHLPTIALS